MSERTRWIVVAVVVLASCTKKDGFSAKIAKGCDTAAECDALVAEAESRIAKCRPNTIGFLDCNEAKADAERVQRLRMSKGAQRREAANNDRNADRDEERRQREAAKEAERLAKELEASRIRGEAMIAFDKLDLKKCALELDAATCFEVETYLAKYPQGDGVPQARAAITTRNHEQARRDREARDKQERASASAGAAAAAEAARNAPKRKRAKCCDDSFDGSCTNSDGAGCCFRRGGVCSWE